MNTLSTKQIVIRIAIIISFAEFLIMLVLISIPHEYNPYLEAVYDAILLILLASPPIYFWVIKPFVDARDDAYAQISHLAYVDPLTQVANRRHLSENLRKAVSSIARHKVYGALLLLDLDNFKHVNDTHGHDAGDAVLVEVTKRMEFITRTEDMVARLGGDEFAVLISHLGVDAKAARDKVARIATKLIDMMRNAIVFDDKTFHVGASIGIRLIGFEEPSMENIIREADIAMYRAKQAGGMCCVIFEK